MQQPGQPRWDGNGTMAVRIKSRWHHSERNEARRKSFADAAGALAFIVWRLSVEHAKEIHREGFDYASDRERIRVISEYCAFAVQLVDRLAHRRIGDEARAVLVVALGRRLADLMQDNLLDVAGPGRLSRALRGDAQRAARRLRTLRVRRRGAGIRSAALLRRSGDALDGRQPDQPLGDGPRHGDLRAPSCARKSPGAWTTCSHPVVEAEAAGPARTPGASRGCARRAIPRSTGIAR